MFNFLKYLINPPVIALFLGGMFTSLFGFLAAVSKKERTPKFISWGAFIAGFIVLVAAIWSGYQDQIKEDLLQAKTEQIVIISQKNMELALTNAKLNEKIANLFTGGNSFCYYLLGFPAMTENRLQGILMHEGEYPLHDIRIRIVNSAKLDKLIKKYGGNTWKVWKEAQEIIHIPTFRGVAQADAFDPEYFKYWNLPKEIDKQSYSIFFSARNGEWHQQISLRRIEDKWKFATRVTNVYGKDKDRVLLIPETILEGYPRNNQGEAEW